MNTSAIPQVTLTTWNFNWFLNFTSHINKLKFQQIIQFHKLHQLLEISINNLLIQDHYRLYYRLGRTVLFHFVVVASLCAELRFCLFAKTKSMMINFIMTLSLYQVLWNFKTIIWSNFQYFHQFSFKSDPKQMSYKP